METFVALLRAVNLGGDSTLQMADFRELLDALGCRNPRTLLQSGNAVFESGERHGTALVARIEEALLSRLGLRSDVLIRTAREWRALISRNPFPEEARRDPSHLLVDVLRDPPTPSSWQALRSAIVGRERVSGTGRECFIYYRDGVGRSKLAAKLIERHLGTIGTSRNWNTVQKIESACLPPP